MKQKKTRKKRISKRGQDLYLIAKQIINKLYNQDYVYNGVVYSKIDLYLIYMKYLRQSAYNGYPEAEFDLGQTYEDMNFWGDNTKCSPKKMLYWYTKACEDNVPEACNCLAYMYDEGIGCSKDKLKAEQLYKKAIMLGSPHAKENLRIMRNQE